MRKPRHHCRNRLNCLAGGRIWPRDHDHRQAQRTGRRQFGRSALPASIFGNDMGDGVGLQHSRIRGHIKWAFGDDKAAIGHGQRAGSIDQAQQEMMLVQARKGHKILLSNRQEHTGWRAGQCGNCPRNIAHMLPRITFALPPWRALQGQERQAQRRADSMCISAHLRSKRVGCVDHMGDPLLLHIISQTRHTAKSAHPHGQGLGGWLLGAPRIGKHCRHPRLCQGAGCKAGFTRAAQQQDAWHV